MKFYLRKGGKKNRQKERRLMKGFNLASFGQSSENLFNQLIVGTTSTPLLGKENLSSRTNISTINERDILSENAMASFGTKGNSIKRSSVSKLSQLAHLTGTKKENKWGNLVEAAKSARVIRIWNRSRSEDSVSSQESARSNQKNDSKRSSLEKYDTNRFYQPRSIVNVTENELPETLEEKGMDTEIKGRMGINPIINRFSPSSVQRRNLQRSDSEPADALTLKFSLTKNWPATTSSLITGADLFPTKSCNQCTQDIEVFDSGSNTTIKPTSHGYLLQKALTNSSFVETIPKEINSVDPDSINGAQTATIGSTVLDGRLQGIQCAARNIGGWL